MLCSWGFLLTFCTEHCIITAVLCAKYQQDSSNEKVTDENLPALGSILMLIMYFYGFPVFHKRYLCPMLNTHRFTTTNQTWHHGNIQFVSPCGNTSTLGCVLFWLGFHQCSCVFHISSVTEMHVDMSCLHHKQWCHQFSTDIIISISKNFVLFKHSVFNWFLDVTRGDVSHQAGNQGDSVSSSW